MSVFAIFRPRSLPLPGGAFSLGFLLVALTLALRFFAISDFETPVLVLFVPAIFATSCVGGFWAGLFATLVACLISDYFLIEPIYSFRITSLSVLTDLLSLLGTGGVVAGICELLRTAIQQSETAKAELEKAHQASRRLAAIVEGSGDAIIGMSLEGIITSWNKSSETIFGYSSAEAIGASIFMLVPPDMHAAEYDMLAEIQAGRTVGSIETRRLRRDGSLVDVSLTISPIRDGRGIVVGASKTMRDISGRKRAEEELRASRATLDAALANMADGIFITDIKGDVIRFNEAFSRVHRFASVDDCFTAFKDYPTMFEAWTPDGEPVPSEQWPVPRAHRGESGVGFEMVVRRKDSGAEWVCTYNYAPIRDDTGKITGGVVTVRDITEQKRADEALRQSLERLEKVLDNQTVGAMFWDLDTGTMVDANQTFLNLMGYSRSDVDEGKLNWQNLTPPEYIDASRAEVAKFLATGRVGPYEKEYFCKNGSRKWLLFAGSSLGDNQCVEFCVDISARKKMEQDLRASEERLTLALDAAKMGTWEWQMRQSQAIWSAQMYRLLGLPEGSGHESPETFTSLVHPDDAARFEETLANLTGDEWHHDFRIIRGDGEVRWLVGVGRVRRGPDGEPETMFGVNYDVTDLKRAEAEAKASRDKLSAAMGSMTDAVFIVDSKGKFVHVNQAFATFHRFSCLEDCLKTLDQFLDLMEIFTLEGQQVPFENWPLNRVLRGEVDVDVELVVRRKDTGDSWIGSYTFAPIRDQAGNLTGAVGTARDITERKQNEARFQSMRDDLYHVGRLGELAQISAGIAHELNQPLAAMFNYATAAKRLIANPEPQSLESAREAISKAAEQAVRAGEIIRRMRAFVEKGESNRHLDDINTIAEDAAALALIGAKAANITTHMDLAPDLPPVLVDRLQLQQVLIILLGNAVEAMADSPRRELTLSTRLNDGFVEVAVTDTGCGMSKDVLERIFMPFITTKAGGMGIGLVISQTIVEAHGGRIHVKSELGVGTTFRFRLPAAQDQLRPYAA